MSSDLSMNSIHKFMCYDYTNNQTSFRSTED